MLCHKGAQACTPLYLLEQNIPCRLCSCSSDTYRGLSGESRQKCWRWCFCRHLSLVFLPHSDCSPDTGTSGRFPRHCWWPPHLPSLQQWKCQEIYSRAWEPAMGEEEKHNDLMKVPTLSTIASNHAKTPQPSAFGTEVNNTHDIKQKPSLS